MAISFDFRNLYWTFFIGYMVGMFTGFNQKITEDAILLFAVVVGTVACLVSIILSNFINANSANWIARIGVIVICYFIYLWTTTTWRPHFMIVKQLKEITKKKVYTPLIIDDQRTADEIFRSAHIQGVQTQNIGTLKRLWFFLSHDKKLAEYVLRYIFGTLPGPISTCYDILWYIIASDNPHGNRLNKTQLKTIAKMKDSQLRKLLPDDYQGPEDRAALIFTLMSGCFVSHSPGERYSDISNYDPQLVYNLTEKYFFPGEDRRSFVFDCPPYCYLSSIKEDRLEQVIKSVDLDNLDATAETWGIELPTKLEKSERYQYLIEQLASYSEVINREGAAEYQSISGLNFRDSREVLLKFTNRELVELYEPRLPWTDRNSLIDVIYHDVNSEPRWSLTTTKHATNDNTYNVIYYELHGNMNKQDPEDPTLSYGTHKNYRCYQLSELVGAFTEREDGIFYFSIPDYNAQVDTQREFPVASITELRTLMINSGKPVYQALIEKINAGLRTMSEAKQKIKTLQSSYQQFNETQKELCELYLAWLFCYGMWMRSWQGPGTPWPVDRVDYVNYDIRDHHVLIQGAVKNLIERRYLDDEKLLTWINDLPKINYDITNPQDLPYCSSEKINDLFKAVTLQGECMGFAADTFVKTALYYITEIFNLKEGLSLNNFFNRQIPKLLNYELEVLEGIRNSEEALSATVRKRTAEIANGFQRQPGFSSYGFRMNRHRNDVR